MVEQRVNQSFEDHLCPYNQGTVYLRKLPEICSHFPDDDKRDGPRKVGLLTIQILHAVTNLRKIYWIL
jgi:hypothetical protein